MRGPFVISQMESVFPLYESGWHPLEFVMPPQDQRSWNLAPRGGMVSASSIEPDSRPIREILHGPGCVAFFAKVDESITGFWRPDLREELSIHPPLEDEIGVGEVEVHR